MQQQQQRQQIPTSQLDQRWQRQYQPPQPTRRLSSRSAAIFDVGFENLFQAGQGVQMSESNYRSTQQTSSLRRAQPQASDFNAVPETNARIKQMSGNPLDTSFYGSAQVLTSPITHTNIHGQQLQQPTSQQPKEIAKLANSLGSNDNREQRGRQFEGIISPIEDDVMIDPELQSGDVDSSQLKQSPASDDVIYPSPSVGSDPGGGYSTINAGGFDIGMEFDWNIFAEDELDGNGGGDMGMGMGLGQVDIFDGFFFGSSGVGGGG